MKTEEIKVGDTIDITGLQTIVTEIVYIAGQRMARTKYGDFAIDLVKKVEFGNPAKENNLK
jgi:hypothetical protein